MGARPSIHHLGTHGWLRHAVAAVLVLILVPKLEVSPTAGASPNACRVRNTETGTIYPTLQAAVDAASKGDRLLVQGTCIAATAIGKTLVVQGTQTRDSEKPTLSGGGRVRVLAIKTATRVKLRDLRIVRGHDKHGGAILNRGHLVLRDVVVCCSLTPYWGAGGGVANDGTLTLNGSSTIRGNAAQIGGGVDNHEGATVTLNGSSSIAHNAATHSGGVTNSGTIVMNGTSTIRGNYADDDGGVTNFGTIVMNDSSTISRNADDEYGAAGVYQRGRSATLTLNGQSSISDNKGIGVDAYGGLVELNDSSSIFGNRSTGVDTSGRLVLNDAASIHANSGGGVVGGDVSLNDMSSIHDNTGHEGAGVFLSGTLTLRDGSSIHGNRTVGYPDGLGEEVPPGPGGGVYVYAGSVLTGVVCGPGGNVYGNTPDDCYSE